MRRRRVSGKQWSNIFIGKHFCWDPTHGRQGRRLCGSVTANIVSRGSKGGLPKINFYRFNTFGNYMRIDQT